MPTLTEVELQIKSVDNGSKYFGKREIKELPNILWEDEKIEKLVQGLYEGSNGILVATNKRLIFVDKGVFWGLRVEDFPYDKITSIQYETGMILGKIIIFASGNKAAIENINKNIARNFADYVRARISSVKEHASLPKESPTYNTDSDKILNQLERLSKLHISGDLTDDEFSVAKKKLLGL